MKPQHLQRYKEIARLFVKYGRGDLVRHSAFGDFEEESASPNAAASTSASPTVHEVPGDILRQEKVRAGLRPADPPAAGDPEPA